ncbi:MAG: SprT-like domain-containing protein [Candidatus Thiodiazotropha sp. (ex Monitilora ramsayi)]|nr:SprT-like domain-containing protein [Candidatus Thiodiazotropha sp. (ex Monitilora ramsayi)]
MGEEALSQWAMEKTAQLIDAAETRYQIEIARPKVHFDLKGKAAGMVIFKPGHPATIRYNLEILRENDQAFMRETVPHEVAHLVARQLYGSRIKPHGKEWRSIMQAFGAMAKRCHNFPINPLNTRKMRYYPYRCSCKDHQLSAIRHNRSQAGVVYLCRTCGSALAAIETPAETSSLSV